MVSLSMTVARHRLVYPRPVHEMPDINMLDLPVEFRSSNLPLGQYYPILIETAEEQHELDAYLNEERDITSSPDLLDGRPSILSTEHITIAHYEPPVENWPYVLLCRWPAALTAAAPADLRMFARDAYTFECFTDREQLERASEHLLAMLKRQRRTRVETVPPVWSATAGAAPH